MENVLIVGASGLLGSRALAMMGDTYNIFGTYNTHKVEGKAFFKLNLLNRTDVFNLVEKIKPSLVLDTHAQNDVDRCELYPGEAWSSHVEATKNIAEASKRAGSKYVYISTDYVFDGKKLDYAEKDKPNPINYYGKTKWAGELILEALDINHLVVRTAVLYGKGSFGKKPFVMWINEKLRNNENIRVVADQYNNPTLVDSTIEAIFKLFEEDATGTFHVTGKECISRYDFSKLTAEVFNLDDRLITPITTPELNQVAKRPAKVRMNTGKIERVAKVKMKTAREGLEILKYQLTEAKMRF